MDFFKHASLRGTIFFVLLLFNQELLTEYTNDDIFPGKYYISYK